eukprot:CAMPEP_0113944010 /NCGR_PEP_ID=MMETSP1339-20121228/30572_1 /TAXON_ID=94617 /ORGANISM="Fibrocapsa japonica" /LENGTH=253 /DNA_ID=CAMNT_0000949049 /DNA_START=61 /DNA_END=822 /DNA_ORIENTATION=+ /assembly_acc=CAM_ASM_000762
MNLLLLGIFGSFAVSDGFTLSNSFAGSVITPSSNKALKTKIFSSTLTEADLDYDAALPFLKEHLTKHDQLLIFGTGDGLAIRLLEDGYGLEGKGDVICIDYDEEKVKTAITTVEGIPALKKDMDSGKIRFECDPFTSFDKLEQSCVDAVVDFAAIDRLYDERGEEAVSDIIEAAHKAVRLGNPLISLSKLDQETYTSFFGSKFGWVEELDGDPTAVSMWYRDQGTNSNVGKNDASDFVQRGLKLYVYSNLDNC